MLFLRNNTLECWHLFPGALDLEPPDAFCSNLTDVFVALAGRRLQSNKSDEGLCDTLLTRAAAPRRRFLFPLFKLG
ncbi:hypothetical protein T4D_13415 [Trichinella pseudospiralis]|uniref:Uncharacterized protein n=1 Tax=Trichinella pseudospiralis TaxID=6337 RepID=A0A0V1FWZ5_TRIPS|nr:hypothetical protein T4D_12681 [Trichinella pseudospiralis]KRY90595.1 hypothetical protein T4D_13415 [Trichinella pseudospiralis]